MKRILAYLLALCLFVSGALAEEAAGIVLPEPEPTVSARIIGDYAEPVNRDVTIYYPGEDGNSLTSLTRSISADRGDQLIQAVLFELFETTDNRAPIRHWPADVKLLSSEFACGTVTVNLSLDAGARQSDFGHLLLCRAIANTLLNMDGITAVNILTAGRSEMLCRLPIGVFTSSSDGVSAEYAILQNEESRFLDEKTAEIKRNAILYFPSRDGRYLLPEAASFNLGDENYISALLSALSRGPKNAQNCFSAIPAKLELLTGEPVIRVDDSGERIAELDISELVTNYLAFSGLESWQLYASVVLTVCSFVPEIDGVRLFEQGVPVSACMIGDERLEFENNILRRRDFAHLIGSCAGRYYANAEGTLTRLDGAISQSGASSAKTILTEMIADRTPSDESLASVFPAEIVPSDILGVRIENGVANVNLSASFYSACQILDSDQERNLIFAMVNALCELEQVGSVRFWVEDQIVDSLSQNIYLKSALMPNPGLVKAVASEE